MTEMKNQQQTNKYIETASDFVKQFNDSVKNPQQNNEEQFVRLMKYITRVVKHTKPKEPMENQEDTPKRRGGISNRDPDVEPKKYKNIYDSEYQKNITKKI